MDVGNDSIHGIFQQCCLVTAAGRSCKDATRVLRKHHPEVVTAMDASKGHAYHCALSYPHKSTLLR